MQRQAAVAEQVKADVRRRSGRRRPGRLNQKLPVVFGTGSVLSFLEANPVDRITVIYKPLMWNVSERIVLIESQGKQYAYYPSDMETKIFADKAVTAPWGGKLGFVPRADLDDEQHRDAGAPGQALRRRPPAVREGRLEGRRERRAVGRADAGPAGLPGRSSSRASSSRSSSSSRPRCTAASTTWWAWTTSRPRCAQIKDQYQRRAEYAEYGISKPFNVMFSGPAGTGKTKLASYLAKELNLPILFHSAANLETGYVAGGSNTLARIVSMAKRRKRCIVFLDEAQDLFMKRGGHRKFDDDTQNTLLAVLDGVRTKSEAEIIWIVASNFNSESMQMDEAMLRRFQMKVDFRMPNKEERLAIIEHYLGQRADKVLPDLDLRHLVEVTEGRSPADLETIVNQAGITAVQAGEHDRRRHADAGRRARAGGQRQRQHHQGARARPPHHRHPRVGPLPGGLRAGAQAAPAATGSKIQAEMKTIKISLKANPRNNALGFVFHKQGANLLKTKGDIEHDVRVLLGGMANEELFFGEEGTTNGAHNDITRVTKLLHHAVGEMGMYRKTRLNFGALSNDGHGAQPSTRKRAPSWKRRASACTARPRPLLARLKPLTEHLAGKLMDAGEMSLKEALFEIRSFEAACFEFSNRAGLAGAR